MPRSTCPSLALLTLTLAGCPAPDTGGMGRYNADPELRITSPASGAAFEQGATVRLEGTVQDDLTPAEEMELSWTSSVDGTLDEGALASSDGEVSLELDDLSLGTHLIRLQGFDADGAEGSDEIALEIAVLDSLPTIIVLHPDGDEAGAVGVPFDLEALVDDPQDAPADLLVEVSSDIDGVLCELLTPQNSGLAVCTVELSAAPDPSAGIDGPHVLTFMVEDLDGNMVSAEAELIVESDRAVDDDGDGVTEDEGDCDDGDDEVFPGAQEVCNGVDDDCDDTIDEEDPDLVDGTTWYQDGDGDGYGLDEQTVVACERPSGYSAEPGDCDDTDAAYHPGASEDDCSDPADYDCDGSTRYADADGDGWAACEDCDDTDAAINPDAAETCDGADNDCDGIVDEDDAADAPTWYGDGDGDGYGASTLAIVACTAPTNFVADDSDCDDGDAANHPGATELCDGEDNDCDGATDEADAADASTWYADGDGDGYGDASVSQAACSAPSGHVADNSDCDDGSTGVNPGAVETCNGVDDDCDGAIDDADADVVGGGTWYTDADGDGYGDTAAATTACVAPSGTVASDGDCDDGDASAHPAGTELCDGVDNDCDGSTDEADAADASTWYADADGDGYGDASASQAACSAPLGHLADDNDCDDTDAGVNPGAVETCSGVDDDCDGLIDDDDGDVTGASTWYLDSDGDGFGLASTSTTACVQPSDHVADDRDCDDADASRHPGADEYCNGEDDDCDGTIDEDTAVDAPSWYPDDDGDGYGDPDRAVVACEAPSGYLADGSDCDDADLAIHPGADELWNGMDDDCDGADLQVVQSAGGYHHSLVLLDDGSVWGWGANYYGQVGDGTTTTQDTPTRIEDLSGVVYIAAGYAHSLAVLDDGSVWAWGWNTKSQLGDGTITDATSPVQVSGITDAVGVACGYMHSLAVLDDGTAWAWGYNYMSQLGDGTTATRSTPVQVSTLTDVVAVTAGQAHSFALKDDGTVWGWGWNDYGTVGDGSTRNRSTPVLLTSLAGAVAISATHNHALALLDDGTVWGWGSNSYGQLGDGTTNNRSTPVQASGLADGVAIATGHYSSFVLLDDGTLWAWGANTSGQLGDGTTSDSTLPTDVSGLTGVETIGAGDHHGFASLEDGSLWTWGYNDYGQLGDGTITNSSLPLELAYPE